MQIIPPKAPRLPMPPGAYERAFQDQHNNALRLYFNQLDNALQQLLLGFNTYGAFYDTTTQTLAAANTATPVTFDTTAEAFGVSVDSVVPSRLVVARSGVFNFQFSAQLDHAHGGSVTFYFWFRKNGADIPDSATKVVIASASSEACAAWNYVVSLRQGEYFELVWAATHADAQLLAEPAAAPVPAIPSVIMTVSYMCPGELGAT